MDFFQAQDSARRNTRSLVFFFAMAVLSLIVITNVLVMVLFGFLRTGEQGLTLGVIAAQFDWEVFFLIGAAVSFVILAGSATRSSMKWSTATAGSTRGGVSWRGWGAASCGGGSPILS